MKRPIFARYFLTFLTGNVLCYGWLFAIVIKITRDYHLKLLINHLHQLNSVLATFIITSETRPDFLGFVRLPRVAGLSGVRFTIVDHTGRVLADSEAEPGTMDDHVNRPEIREAFLTRRGVAQRYSNTLKQWMLYVATAAPTSGKNPIVVRASLPFPEVNSFLRSSCSLMLWPLAVGLLFSLVISFWLTAFTASHLTILNRGFQSLARGIFTERTFLGKNPELSELADGFNNVAHRMNELSSELSQQKERLFATFASLDIGLCIFDRSGQASLWNKAFTSIVSPLEPAGKTYWELLHDTRLMALVEKSLKECQALSSEFDWQHHIYRMSVIPLGMPPEVLLVLHDITEVKTMDRRKNDFLARVSHELRTPLTAIKGYAETLTVEGEKNQRFLEIIKKHTERIIALVNDLMLLSQLEETGPRLVREKVDCLTLVKEVVTLFEREIERKKLRLSPEVTPKTFVYGDRFYL
ncbi:MAG TPA: histidine kinase dimerization/phospho-acceptor domain-containing protein [bacterium]|nr:histidine kinase dimerization/phospho-acceptor domain-containing protein [bacterium]